MGINEELWNRLAILEDNGLISSTATKYCKEAIQVICSQKSMLDEDRLAMFVTHLAMASQRVLDGTIENPIGSKVLDSVKQEPIYAEAQCMADALLAIGSIEFPQTEREYLVVHLCSLFS